MSRSAGPPRPFGCDRRDLALLLALAAAAGALLFHGLDRVYLWQDEAATALMGERLLAHGKPLAWDGGALAAPDIPYGNNPDPGWQPAWAPNAPRLVVAERRGTKRP